MKLKNVLIAVSDVEKSKQFYHDLFGLDVILDGQENVILTEGLVLQEKQIWENTTGCPVVPENHAFELYFETRDLEGFVRKLEELYPETRYVSRLTAFEWGQKMVRFYDPDGNLIEVRE